MAAMTTVKN